MRRVGIAQATVLRLDCHLHATRTGVCVRKLLISCMSGSVNTATKHGRYRDCVPRHSCPRRKGHRESRELAPNQIETVCNCCVEFAKYAGYAWRVFCLPKLDPLSLEKEYAP
jgi:hypothetical protein